MVLLRSTEFLFLNLDCSNQKEMLENNNIDINEIEDEDEVQGLFEHHRIEVDPGQSLTRVDKFVMDKLPNATRNKVQQGIELKQVLVNDLPTKASYQVKPGDIITISMPEPPRETDLKPENIPLDIVYEDEHILVINKAAGMVVHPAHGNWSGTLVNALVYHFQNLPTSQNGVARPGLIHRIDKDNGRHAITHYKTLENLRYVTLIQCNLETGRTHQIRAHMKHLGHPLFNDATYTGDKVHKGTLTSRYKAFVENCFKLMPRQALHAKSLGFIHPSTNEFMQFETDLPADFTAVLEKWRHYLQYN